MKLYRILFITVFPVTIAFSASEAGTGLKLIITSNLSGGFSPAVEEQEEKDPVILTAKSIKYEKRRGADIYIDMGNAFYPGVIAKYSFGSAMMDFFNFTGCALSLVSSSDLKIGVNTLEFLQKGSRTKLVSGNLLQKGMNVFHPYHVINKNGVKIAFIGLSSNKVFVDIAEMNLFDIRVNDEMDSLERIMPEIKGAGIEHIVLLSGLDDKSNLKILKTFSEIDLIISGGDRSSGILNEGIVRMDTSDSRSVLGAYNGSGYYILDLDIDPGLTVRDYSFHESSYRKSGTKKYREFISRITRWKEHYLQKTGEIVAVAEGKVIRLDNTRVSHLMRDVFNTEISILTNNSITTYLGTDSVSESSIISSINDNYPVFVFKLSGAEITELKPFIKKMTITGLAKNKVQGYDINPARNYRISATQPVFQMIEIELGKTVPYTNTWKNLSEIIISDLKGGRVLLNDDFSYLDNRFRITVDVLLSNFFERSRIRNRNSIEAPPGQADKSYRRWGVEDRVDFTLYNRYHRFVLTPYIYYVKEGGEYINNLMRGTFIYSLNIGRLIQPYHKSQCDTVVSRDEGKRPTLIRETVGGNIESRHVTGKIGLGFERHVHDELEPAVYGFETLITISYDFMEYFSYSLKLDSFVSFSPSERISQEQGYIRGELENRLLFRVTTLINLSLKHKYYRYYLIEDRTKFTESQFVTSLDLKTDFKLF